MKNLVFILFLCSVCLGYSPSITSYNTGQITPLLEGRSDFQKYNSASRTLENVFVYAEGPVTRRPGTRYITQVPGEIIGFEPPDANYNWMVVIPEWGNASARTNLKIIYGYNGVHVSVADINNIGGDLWGIPTVGHPFVSGQQIEIVGSSAAIDDFYTLQAQTTANELVISDNEDFSSITFDGTERVHLARDIYPEAMWSGRCATDGTYIYYPCYRENTYASCVMRFDVNGTVDTNWKVNPANGWSTPSSNLNIGLSVFVVDNSTNVIVVSAKPTFPFSFRITKAAISDGSEIWQINASFYRYAMPAVDDNFIYTAPLNDPTPASGYVRKYSIVDGSFQGTLTGMLSMNRDLVVSQGVVVGCRERATGSVEKDCNIAIWDIDEEEVRARVTLTDVDDECYWADVRNDHIYTTYKESGGYNIAKIDLQGNIIAQALTSFSETNQIISQYWRFDNKFCVVALMSASANDSDGDYIEVFDEDLVSEGLMLNTGRTYGTTFSYWPKKHPLTIMIVDGVLRDYDWVKEQIDTLNITDADETVRLIPFEHSTDDAYALGLGDSYMSFFRTIE